MITAVGCFEWTGDAQLESADSAPPAPWLDRLNHYRTMAGLPPVGQNLALNTDCSAHASYLVQQMPTDRKELLVYRHSIGAEVHHEDASSVYYTAAGAECAQGGKRVPYVLGAGDGRRLRYFRRFFPSSRRPRIARSIQREPLVGEISVGRQCG